MASKIFSGLRSIKHYQRLSISDIQKNWSQEIHQRAGHKRYQTALGEFDKGVSQGEENPLLELAQKMSHLGKWVDDNGNFVESESIAADLVEFVNRGDLKAYVGMSPDSEECSIEKLSAKNFVTQSNSYHLDRDELGRFLVASGIELPRFWYDSQDTAIYQDQIQRQDAECADLRSQLTDLMNENASLTARLLDAMPFMNPDHPYFSPELEAAVSLWLDSYGDKKEAATIRKKPALENWLRENRGPAVSQPNGALSKSALERITMVVNPDKKGGRSAKKQ